MNIDDFLSHVRIFIAGCWQWTGAIGNTGYGRVERSEYAHRMAYRLFVRPIPRGMFVLHHCDNKLCVRPSHLYLGTHQDNMRDARERGRTMAALHPERIARGDRTTARAHPEAQVRGVRHPGSKLTEDMVRAIRRRYPAESLTDLAVEYHVSRHVVYDAAIGNTWRHVDEPPSKPSYRKGHGRARDRVPA